GRSHRRRWIIILAVVSPRRSRKHHEQNGGGEQAPACSTPVFHRPHPLLRRGRDLGAVPAAMTSETQPTVGDSVEAQAARNNPSQRCRTERICAIEWRLSPRGAEGDVRATRG